MHFSDVGQFIDDQLLRTKGVRIRSRSFSTHSIFIGINPIDFIDCINVLDDTFGNFICSKWAIAAHRPARNCLFYTYCIRLAVAKVILVAGQPRHCFMCRYCWHAERILSATVCIGFAFAQTQCCTVDVMSVLCICFVCNCR